MTLSDFRELTAHLPGDLDIKVLLPWGEIDDAELIEAGDLDTEDPVRQSLEENPVVLLASANPMTLP